MELVSKRPNIRIYLIPFLIDDIKMRLLERDDYEKGFS